MAEHASLLAERDFLARQLAAQSTELYALRDQAARRAANCDPPPTFPHLHASTIADHLILTSLTKGWQQDGNAPADIAKKREAHLKSISQPHLDVSLSPTDISFKPSVPGSVQQVEVALRNDSMYPIVLRELRLVGPVCEPPPFSVSAGAPQSEHGVIVMPGDEQQLTVRCEAPDERGLSRQWLFAIIEATEADERTVRIAHFALAATLVMYTFHSQSIADLSAEAPPFFPAEWRAIWTAHPLVQLDPPPPIFPQFAKTCELMQLDMTNEHVLSSSAMWEEETTRLARLAESVSFGSYNWKELHVLRMRRLLIYEEHQQALDYDKMDVFSTEARGSHPKKAGAWTITIDVPGLQEQHPPLMAGDALRMRLQDLTTLEVGLRVVNVTSKTVLVLQPLVTRDALLTAARNAASIETIETLLVRDDEHPGVVAVEALIGGGRALCHLRFLLNRSMMRYMQHTLSASLALCIRFQQGAGVSKANAGMPTSMLMPTLAKAMGPVEADALHDDKLEATTVWRCVTCVLEPIQPQINPEQMQAVTDILVNKHGSLPYLVFGPPGTGKTLVMIETVLQALLHVDKPRLLVCAPSNAAADVIARRLARLLPTVTNKRRLLQSEEQRFTMLRLNSQQRTLGEVSAGGPELLAYCSTDKETSMFTVPPLLELKSKTIIVATCGATHLLIEAGLVPVHSNVNGIVLPHKSGVNVSGRFPKNYPRLLETGGHFTHILIDEASQGLEAELMMPLALAYPGASTALCGDHKQLGPVVRSSLCRKHGLAVSMLERLIQLPVYKMASGAGPSAEDGAEGGAVGSQQRARCVTKLVRNYRSHRALLELPSRVSYGGELLEHGDREVTGSMGDWDELVAKDFPLLFYGCASAHSLFKIDPSSAHPSSSYRNVTEAEKIVELISSLLTRHNDAADTDGANAPSGTDWDDLVASADADAAVALAEGGTSTEPTAEEAQLSAEASGSTSPYVRDRSNAAAQAATSDASSGGVRRKVTTNDIGVVTPFRAQVMHLRQRLRALGLGAIRVGTVDDYQGQEELIIIISTVIGSANPRSVGAMAHGLMSSPQRFNVAITRAKALLVIVGDPNALWEDTSWRELLQYSVDHGSYRGCPQPLAINGTEDDSLDALAGLINQAAQRTLLGAGASSLMFPGLVGDAASIWAGDGYDVDEEQGWKVAF